MFRPSLIIIINIITNFSFLTQYFPSARVLRHAADGGVGVTGELFRRASVSAWRADEAFPWHVLAADDELARNMSAITVASLYAAPRVDARVHMR